MTALLQAVFTSVGSAVSSVASGIGSMFSSGTAAASGPLDLGKLAAGSGTSSSLTFANVLQGGLGIVQAMGALRAGQTQSSAYRSEAADTRLDVTQEAIDATDRQTSLRKQLIAALGERDTAYAASGVDLSFGTPQQARTEAIQSASDAITTDQSNSDLRKSRLRSRAASLDAMAADASSAGGLKAAGSLLETGIDILARG